MASHSNQNELSILTEITELIEHNTRMLKDAEAGNWESVRQAEVERESMIQTFYAHARQNQRHQAIAQATRELIRVNERLKQLAIEARDKAQNELAELSKSKVAISAYEKNRR